MGVVAAIAAAGVAVSAGTSAYASSSASSSAAAAQAQNAQNIQNTNQLNYQLFQQGRGSTGSAIYPIYAKGAEQQLYNDTLNTYDATGALQPTAAQLQSIVGQQVPTLQQANAAGAGIFNGNLQNQLLAAQQPVYQAQLQAAQTQKQGTLEALQSTLNNIKSIQAGKGYAGDSFGNQLLNFQARQGANTQIANQFSQANIGNAQAVQGIKSGVLGTQLNNLNLPGTLAANATGLANLPSNTLAQNQAQRQQLFNNFRIGTNQFQYQNLPTVNPIAGAGQIAGQAGASLASGIGNYFANQNLTNQLNSTPSGATQAAYMSTAYPGSYSAGGSYIQGGISLPPSAYTTPSTLASTSGSIAPDGGSTSGLL